MMRYKAYTFQEGEEDKSTANLLCPTSLELAGMSVGYGWVCLIVTSDTKL